MNVEVTINAGINKNIKFVEEDNKKFPFFTMYNPEEEKYRSLVQVPRGHRRFYGSARPFSPFGSREQILNPNGGHLLK